MSWSRSLPESATGESWSKSERRKRAKSCDDPKGFTMQQFCRNQKTRSGKGERTNESLLRQLIREELLRETTGDELPSGHWAQWINLFNPIDAYENYTKNLAVQKETDLALDAIDDWIGNMTNVGALGVGGAAGYAGYASNTALAGSVNIAAKLLSIPSASVKVAKMILAFAKGDKYEVAKNIAAAGIIILLGEKGDDGVIWLSGKISSKIPSGTMATLANVLQRVATQSPDRILSALKGAGIVVGAEILTSLLSACSDGMFALAAEQEKSDSSIPSDLTVQMAQNLEGAAKLAEKQSQTVTPASPPKTQATTPEQAPPAPKEQPEREPYYADWEKPGSGWSVNDPFPEDLRESRWAKLAGILDRY